MEMIDFCHRYIPNYLSISTSLRLLTKKYKSFEWSTEQETTFQQLKATLSNIPVMDIYDPQANTSVTVDASPTGLGKNLSQLQPDGITKTISYAS